MIDPTESAADEPLLAFGSGAADDDHGPPTAESDERSLSGADFDVDGPGIPTGDAESHNEFPEEPQDAAGTDSGATGLLEHVAEAVGDLWDDTTDVMT